MPFKADFSDKKDSLVLWIIHVSLVFQSLGGLGMFLFGMKIMSEGLQKVAGRKMRPILNTVSNNRVVGCVMGPA